MTDYRISAGKQKAVEKPSRATLLDVLVKRADEVEERFQQLSSQFPYRATAMPLIAAGSSNATRGIATATWKRLNDEVPNYGFAEELGRRYRTAGHPLTSIFLHWQLLRRAVHLVLAEHSFRTGEGDPTVLRQMMLMNYTIDWGTEASLVGYVLGAGSGSGAGAGAAPARE